MEGAEKPPMHLLLKPVELSKNQLNTLFKFKPSSNLKSLVISKTEIENTYYSLAEVLTVLKDVILCEGMFDPNNPYVILWAEDLKKTFYMRDLHVMEIRDFVLSHLTASTDQSSTEKFAQRDDTYQGNITDLTKIKTKVTDEYRPPKFSSTVILDRNTKPKFLQVLQRVPSADPKKNVFTNKEAGGLDCIPDPPLDSCNGVGGSFVISGRKDNLPSNLRNNENILKSMGCNEMGVSFEKGFSLPSSLRNDEPSCLKDDPASVFLGERPLHKGIKIDIDVHPKNYRWEMMTYMDPIGLKLSLREIAAGYEEMNLIWTHTNYQELPLNLQICLELTYMMKIIALFHLIMVAMDFWTGNVKSKFKQIMMKRDENVSNLGIGRCVAGLVQHLQQIANDIEVNPGPISYINIRWMVIFLRLDFNVRKEYTKKLLKNIKDLYEDFVDGNIVKTLYTEENLNTIQDILEFCITEHVASEPKDQIEQLQTNWYEKVREIERSATKRPLTDNKDEKICRLGNRKLPKTKRPRSSYEEVKQSAHYACPLCQKAFKRKYGCEKHIKEMHPYGAGLKAQYTIPLSANTDAAALTIPDDELVYVMNMTGQFNLPTPEYQMINGDLFSSAQLASNQEPKPQVDTNLGNSIFQENI